MKPLSDRHQRDRCPHNTGVHIDHSGRNSVKFGIFGSISMVSNRDRGVCIVGVSDRRVYLILKQRLNLPFREINDKLHAKTSLQKGNKWAEGCFCIEPFNLQASLVEDVLVLVWDHKLFELTHFLCLFSLYKSNT